MTKIYYVCGCGQKFDTELRRVELYSDGVQDRVIRMCDTCYRRLTEDYFGVE